MKKIRDNDTSYYYSNVWENNGYRITEICDNGYIVWRNGKVVKCFNSFDAAESYTEIEA